MNTAFSNSIDQFLERTDILNADEDVLIFFKGFPLDFYESIEHTGIKHFTNNWDGQYPDIRKIKGTDYLSPLISAHGQVWGFYEELIALADILSDFSAFPGKIVVVDNNLFHYYYPIPCLSPQKDVEECFNNETIKQPDSYISQFYSDYKVDGDILLLSYVNKHYEVDVNLRIEELDFYDTHIIDAYNVRNECCIDITISSLVHTKYLLQDGRLEEGKYRILGDATTDLNNEICVMNVLGSFYNIVFGISETEMQKREETEECHLDLLKKYWGKDAEFRNNKFYTHPDVSNETVDISQGIIIADIIKQCLDAKKNDTQYSDIIVTAPTGAGKSVFFQIPAIYLHERETDKPLTIVLSPLIALMKDQVLELQERGIEYATYINSTISYKERMRRLDGIKDGEYSIVYLSPELLLSSDISTLIGERKIGLMVIDEAHLVTSWGRDFRVDYWFLGDHIERIRRGTSRSSQQTSTFPMLCLTATAVYGGRDDVINDLQGSLHLTCYSGHMYIGYVRRDNIIFDIRQVNTKNKDKEEKLQLTTAAVCKYVKKHQKTIVYFPYKSQIEDVLTNITDKYPDIATKVTRYYSSDMESAERDKSYDSFKDSDATVMLATKAFGMGINISDVENIYHYAPTGALADYVQEIGRAARKLKVGYAITDYLGSDMNYARTLWGLSGLRHYQIKAIINKLCSIYEEKKHRNLLVSPDTFSYLFDTESVDLKLKSGLMLLSTDLLNKYHFKVITVRSKNLFSKQYIIVPNEIEEQFLERYGRYCEMMQDCMPDQQYSYGKAGDCIITKTGNVFEIDLGEIWENDFSNETFAQFKYNFFNGKLFDYGKHKIVPNMKLTINYNPGYDKIELRFKEVCRAIQDTFNDIKRLFGGRRFTMKDFSSLFNKRFDPKIKQEYLNLLLELFCFDHVETYNNPSEPWKFIEKKRGEAGKNINIIESMYSIKTQRYSYISNNLKKYFWQAKPNMKDGIHYVTYLTVPKPGTQVSYQQLMASILQLFGLATYEYEGGKNPQIFVRINDPRKLMKMRSDNYNYKNGILSDIENRHKRAVRIMNSFMINKYSNDERWDIIENYFLGHDTIVDSKLETNKVKRNDVEIDITNGVEYDGSDYHTIWDSIVASFTSNDNEIKLSTELVKRSDEFNNHERPVSGDVSIDGQSLDCNCDLIWVKSRVMYFMADEDKEIPYYNIPGWTCFFGADPNLTVDRILNAIEVIE